MCSEAAYVREVSAARLVGSVLNRRFEDTSNDCSVVTAPMTSGNGPDSWLPRSFSVLRRRYHSHGDGQHTGAKDGEGKRAQCQYPPGHASHDQLATAPVIVL